MADLLIIESICVICSLASLLKPLLKPTPHIPGFALLPALSLLLLILAHVIFGWRPELAAFTIAAAIHALSVLPSVSDEFRGLRPKRIHTAKTVRSIIASCFLSAAFVFAILHVPLVERVNQTPSFVITDKDEACEYQFFVSFPTSVLSEKREETSAIRPLMIIAPEYRHVSEVNRLAIQAAASGRAVIVVTCRFSFFAAIKNSLSRILCDLFGRRWAFAANIGRHLEENTLHILPRLIAETETRIKDRLDGSSGKGEFTVLAYTIEASSLLLAAGAEKPPFYSIIAIEPPLYSALALPLNSGASIKRNEIVSSSTIETEPDGASQSKWTLGSIAFSLWSALVKLPEKLGQAVNTTLDTIGLRGITGTQSLPPIKVPSLLIAGDGIAAITQRDGRYSGLLRSLHSSASMSALIYIPGAAATEYSDIPLLYPSRARPTELSRSGAVISALSALTEAWGREKTALTAMVEDVAENFNVLRIERNRLWISPANPSILSQ